MPLLVFAISRQHYSVGRWLDLWSTLSETASQDRLVLGVSDQELSQKLQMEPERDLTKPTAMARQNELVVSVAYGWESRDQIQHMHASRNTGVLVAVGMEAENLAWGGNRVHRDM